MPLTIDECATLEAYGISTVGDVVMLSEFVEDAPIRRSRSKTRALEVAQRRVMEGMQIVSEQGTYQVLRYVHPEFIIKWSDDRTEVVRHDRVRVDMSGMAGTSSDAYDILLDLSP